MSDHHHKGCDDWLTTRRAALARTTQHIVPLPEQALTDGPGAGAEIFRTPITRRQALIGASGLAIATAALPKFGARGMFEAAQAQAAADPNARILVSIYLDGGNDGLNTFIPLADPKYATYRSRVGIPAARALPVTGYPDFGWHPALTGLKQLFDQGKVAVLPAVDYTPSDQSHFASQIYWRTGVVGEGRDLSGWLGRTIDVLGTSTNPLQAISLGWGMDPILQSKSAPVATIFDPGDFSFYIPGVWGDNGAAAITPYRLAVAGAKSRARQAAQAAMRNSIGVYDQLAPLRAQGDNVPPPPVAYSDDNFGKGLRNLARLLGAGFGTRVAALSQGGYDTHNNQPEDHNELLTSLGTSLAAWQADLDARGLSDRVMTMVWSEFGRRVEDNDSNGTDHGAGGLCMLIGNHANGGVRSEFPGLAVLDEDDNLRVTTQFRTMYASILEGWLGIEAGRIIPGVDAARLPLFK